MNGEPRNRGRRVVTRGVAAVVCLLAGAAAVAAPAPDPDDPAAGVLTVAVDRLSATVYAGRGTVVNVPLRLKAGWHVQANPSATGYIATELLPIKCGQVRVGTRRYPPGRPFRLAGADEALNVYEGDFTISFAVVAPPTAVVNAWRAVEMELRYQPCDATTCYPPRTIPITAKIRILPAAGPKASARR